MKKISTLTIFLVTALYCSAQFTPVPYRGAFAPAPTPMWTDGWANWDPQTTTYPATTTTISGHITTNTTWTSTNVYLLSGVVYVDSLVTLTIQPGTIIRGNNSVANSSLLIKRGAKLIAEGTATSPIVFTSNVVAGQRNKGDWGGVILLGRAKNNLTGGVGYIEGLTQTADNAHGGNDDADNSGVLKYVRIEYGGYVFAPNSEINGLTFGSIGSGTTVDYVQVSFSNDDSYEWFGGTVNCTHLVAYRGLDDDFDTDNGFSGKIQFGLGVRDPNIADNPTVSTSEGFESDNDAGGSTNTPQTSATFSNITIIGPYRGNSAASVAPGFRRGARLRRNSAQKIFNTIFMDYATGLFIDGSAAKLNAYNGLLKYKNNIVALASPQPSTQKVAEDDSSRAVFFNPANMNDLLGTTAGILITPYNFTAPDYRPAEGSPALTNYDFTDAALLPVTLAKFYGTTIKKSNVLYWQTENEANNNGFELMRSADGNNFGKIGFIPSLAPNGTSAKALNYQFVDDNALTGKSFYMLRQIDKDGRVNTSPLVVLDIKGNAALNFAALYPNPAHNLLNISLVSAKRQNATFIIVDMYGRRVTQKMVSLPEGTNIYQVNISSLAPGTYMLNILSADGTLSTPQKFIKR